MSDATWTWILFGMEIVGVLGMLMVGRKLWWGWAIVLLHSIPWFIYSISHDKPGFIAMSLMWWVTHAYNMMKWRKENNKP
jgi:hypothetical protein